MMPAAAAPYRQGVAGCSCCGVVSREGMRDWRQRQ